MVISQQISVYIYNHYTTFVKSGNKINKTLTACPLTFAPYFRIMETTIIFREETHMKRNKLIALLLSLCLLAAMPGCAAQENAVYVQSVKTLANLGAIAPGDRFPGIVVSENITEIHKDSDKAIAEVLV